MVLLNRPETGQPASAVFFAAASRAKHGKGRFKENGSAGFSSPSVKVNNSEIRYISTA
jgi:hypothetical protein